MRHFQATSGIGIGIRTQSTTYLPHQANVEQLFSRSGNLSDPNMDPMFLAALTSIGANKKAYKPTVAEIKEMYRARTRLPMKASVRTLSRVRRRRTQWRSDRR